MLKLKSFVCLNILLVMMFSCQKPALDEGQSKDDVLTLKASSQTLVLDINNAEETALTFSWSTGTNYGTGKAILYSLNIAPIDGEYKEESAIELGKRIYSHAFTTAELNTLIFKMIPYNQAKQEKEYKALLTATIPDDDRVQKSEITFKVVSYRPVPGELSIDGTSLSNMSHGMLRGPDAKFVWQGELSQGNLRAFNNDYDIEISATIEKAGRYNVIADMTDDSIEIYEDKHIYLVTEESDWSFVEMDMKSEGVYSILCDLKRSQFKFGTIPGAWHYMYVAEEKDNAPWDSKTAVFQEEASSIPDNKWFVDNNEHSPYEIKLDIRTTVPQMIMTPYHRVVSMVGDATPGGWDLGQKTVLTRTEIIKFEWNGELKVGELKFCCGENPGYGVGDWFMPEVDQTEFTDVDETQIQLINAETGIDKKWKVTEDGVYNISLNQYTGTLTIKKL